MNHEKLHVIAVISNPRSYESRYRLYRKFAKYMRDFHNVVLWTAELAIGEQEFAITESDNPHHFQFRTPNALWHKENLINATVRRLPKGCKYIAAIDADVIFADPDWANNTIEALKRHPVVQMFSEVQDLSPNNTVVSGKGFSFMHSYHKQGYNPRKQGYSLKGCGATGFAWAWTREAFEALGGLTDYVIIGSADWYMAHGYFGFLHASLVAEIGHSCPEYHEKLMGWQANAQKVIGGNVGCVPGLILHYWHGRRSERGYQTRNKHLVDNHFNPHTDICYNQDGILEFTGSNPGLRDGIAEYFATRNEDSKVY